MAVLDFEVRVIEPAEADSLLSKKRSNAPVRLAQVKSYAHEMTAGNWVLNGDPIIIGKSGAVLSGVLRLEACKLSARSFPALVVSNIEDDTFETIDSVRRRTVSDILAIRKEESGRVLASALGVLWRYSSANYVKTARTPSAQTVLDMLGSHPEIRTSVVLTRSLGSGFPHGVAAALHYIFSLADPDAATLFFDDYRLEKPSISAVEALKRNLEGLAEKGGAKRQPYIIGLAIRAWEAARKGTDVKLLRFDPDVNELPMVSGVDAEALVAGVSKSSAVPPRQAVRLASHNLRVELETITPDRAMVMLEANTANRTVAAQVVDKYARDMASGAWAVNGQTLKFGQTGRLLDGQHRLHACVKSKVPFVAVVVSGLDEKVFETFDLGARRSLGDILIDRGETNTSTLAAMLRQFWLLETGMLTSNNASPTVAEMLGVLEQHPEIRDSVRWVHKIKSITAPTLLLALHYQFSRKDKGKADEFIERVGDGAELPRKHPILTLRDQLLRARNERKYQLADPERAAWIIKAWNAYVEDRALDHIKWQPNGARAEAFPLIRGPRESKLAA